MTWLFVVLVLLVFAERRTAEWDFNNETGVLWQNDDAVDGEELLNRLLLVNDVALPIVVATTLPGAEQPVLPTILSPARRSERGLESRAPPTALPTT